MKITIEPLEERIAASREGHHHHHRLSFQLLAFMAGEQNSLANLSDAGGTHVVNSGGHQSVVTDAASGPVVVTNNSGSGVVVVGTGDSPGTTVVGSNDTAGQTTGTVSALFRWFFKN